MNRSERKRFPASYLKTRRIRGAVREIQYLHQLERAGESEWTPWIAVAGLVVFFLAIGLVMVGIAEVASYLLASAFLQS